MHAVSEIAKPITIRTPRSEDRKLKVSLVAGSLLYVESSRITYIIRDVVIAVSDIKTNAGFIEENNEAEELEEALSLKGHKPAFTCVFVNGCLASIYKCPA